ncbi:MAG: hypothetical protein ACR2RV_04520 [Verrucomicrobiales bacterium]
MFREFECGRISREQLQAAMALIQQELIKDIEDARQNPLLACMDKVLSKQAASKLRRRYPEPVVREVLAALAEVPDFPPSHLLWNAGHRDVPLYCFLRPRREPVFRILNLEVAGRRVEISVEHGPAKRRDAIRETFTLRRHSDGQLLWESRQGLS